MNYFEYFSEIEERFTARRGSLLLLSTLDWALIETWRAADVPLAAVLRGIDAAFDRYDARKARARGRLAKVNGLAWCAQAVMEAAAEMAEAAVGTHTPTAPLRDTGFEAQRIARFLEANAEALERAIDSGTEALGTAGSGRSESPNPAYAATAQRLGELAAEVRGDGYPALDELDRTLTVLEERLHAAIVAAAPETEMLALRETADRELAAYRGRLGAVQMRQVREQFVHKRLFEARRLPRLSLFYMPLAESPDGEAAA